MHGAVNATKSKLKELGYIQRNNNYNTQSTSGFFLKQLLQNQFSVEGTYIRSSNVRPDTILGNYHMTLYMLIPGIW